MWLWTGALRLCYRPLTLSLTVKSWMVWGYIWGGHSSQRRSCLVKPPCITSPKLRTAELQSLKIDVKNSISVQDWFYMWRHHTQRQCLKWQKPLSKPWKLLVDPGEHLNFAIKKDVGCNIAERIFFNIKNQFVIARLPRRWM